MFLWHEWLYECVKSQSNEPNGTTWQGKRAKRKTSIEKMKGSGAFREDNE